MMRFFTIFCFLAFNISAQEKLLDSQFQEISKKTLEETWQAILKHNFNANAEQEWKKIYETSRPKILKSKNNRELVKSINEMIGKLGQSHIHLLPPVNKSVKKAAILQKKSRAATSEKEAKTDNTKVKKPEHKAAEIKKTDINKGKAADPGLRLCIAGNKICVLDVSKKSTARKSGIKMGDEISKIYGFKFNLKQYSDCPWDFIAESMLMGNYGTNVPLTVVDSKGNSRDISLKRKSVYGPWLKIGVMPKMAGKVEYKILKNNIGYIYLTPCFPPQLIKMQKLISNELKNCKGLIIDLRNNPGGMMVMAQGMAGWVTDKELEMGKLKTREVPLKLKSYPQESAFTGPLAVLVNKGTFSTAEVFAAGIQDNKRAKVFGETTAGKCLPSIFIVLSTGFRLQTVFGDFKRINGKSIEKEGVKPDFVVKQTQADLVSGIDTACEAARKYLLKESN